MSAFDCPVIQEGKITEVNYVYKTAFSMPNNMNVNTNMKEI